MPACRELQLLNHRCAPNGSLNAIRVGGAPQYQPGGAISVMRQGCSPDQSAPEKGVVLVFSLDGDRPEIVYVADEAGADDQARDRKQEMRASVSPIECVRGLFPACKARASVSPDPRLTCRPNSARSVVGPASTARLTVSFFWSRER